MAGCARPGTSRCAPPAPRATTIDSSAVERQLGLGQDGLAGRAPETRQGVFRVRRVGQADLASPVVAAGRHLEPER